MVGVISAGGKGTRLSSLISDIPKPMVKVCGKPILEYQIECLYRNNIKKIYIIIGHLGHVIKEYFQDGSNFGVSIEYIEEKEPLGTAGGLFYLKSLISSTFVFMYGDLMLDIDISKMLNFHLTHQKNITLFTHPNSHPFDSDLIVEDENHKVIDIDSKHNIRNYYFNNLVNAGVFMVSNKIFDDYFQNIKKMDFEKDIVYKEIMKGNVYSYRSSEYVKDAGTPERYFEVCEDVKKQLPYKRNLSNKQKCIFLDRDGTINKLKGFIIDINTIELENGVVEGIKDINNSEFLTIVITNQPVIARGEVTEEQLRLFHNKIETLLGEKGAYLDDLFYCPHHPDSGFKGEIKELKIKCSCRKPNIGLILLAKEKYNLDLSNSYFVGDSTTDILTGLNAGTKTVLVNTGNKGKDAKYTVKPDYTVDSLQGLNKIIF